MRVPRFFLLAVLIASSAEGQPKADGGVVNDDGAPIALDDLRGELDVHDRTRPLVHELDGRLFGGEHPDDLRIGADRIVELHELLPVGFLD